MILALILGGFLLSTNPEKMRSGWFHMKLTGVIGLIGCDIWSGLLARQFSRYGLQKRQWVYFLLQGLILFFIFVILAGILLGKKG
ncbi:MAG: hypothetical protein JWO53_1161 [Chlamydiia bacterium]|nr:hypothetical protein [Chlamydiia bacterium]